MATVSWCPSLMMNDPFKSHKVLLFLSSGIGILNVTKWQFLLLYTQTSSGKEEISIIVIN